MFAKKLQHSVWKAPKYASAIVSDWFHMDIDGFGLVVAKFGLVAGGFE